MRGLFRFIFGLIGFALVILVLTAAWIVFDGLRDQGDRADIALVPSVTMPNGNAPDALPTETLDAAVRLYNSGRFPLIDVSGPTQPGGYDEAKEMAHYLETHGIPHGSIVVDNQGMNTAATAQDLARAMKWRDIHSTLIVTPYYHVSRTKMALQEAAIADISQYHTGTLRPEDAVEIAREAVAFHYYWIRFYLLPEAKILEAKAQEDAPKMKEAIQQDTEKAKNAVQQNLNSLHK